MPPDAPTAEPAAAPAPTAGEASQASEPTADTAGVNAPLSRTDAAAELDTLLAATEGPKPQEVADKEEPGAGAVEPKTESDILDRVALQKAAQERRYEQQRQQQPEPARSPEEIRAEVAREYEQRQQTFMQAFWADPVGFAEKHGHDPVKLYERFGQAATDRPALEAQDRMGRLESQVKELLEQVKTQNETSQREAHNSQRQAEFDRARKEYLTHLETGGEHYPLLAALDPDEQVQRGVDMAVLLRNAGRPHDTVTVARHVEQDLRTRYHARWNKPTDRSEPATTETSTTPTTTPGGEEPNTITSEQTAQTTGRTRRTTHEERLAEAERLADEWAKSRPFDE